jgi:DNA-binding MarR family transcriptional regulator
MKAAIRKPVSAQNLALSAWIRLLKVHNLVIRQTRSKMAKHCTLSQFDVLAHLSRQKEGSTLADLSRHLLVTAGNITGLIDRMEGQGYVKRIADQYDRRVKRVQLTDAGERLAAIVLPKHSHDITEAFWPLTEQEKLQLRTILDKLIAGLENNDIGRQKS